MQKIVCFTDFLSMKVMNKVLRNSKAFFMRRKFVDDHVYRSVFQEYIKAMISYEESPIEFFIEGTRSRTGKSLSPKFGIECQKVLIIRF